MSAAQEPQDDTAPYTMQDVETALACLNHISECEECQQRYMHEGTKHFVLWHQDDFITCLVLPDQFLTYSQFLAYIKQLAVQAESKETR